MKSARGFTLLEVMVSLSILALILTALSGVSANSFVSSNYANQVTVATLLARSKMLDIEQELLKDGFGDDDKEFDGDFEKEGFPSYSFVAVCRPIEVDVGQLVGSLLGGDVETEDLNEQVGDYIEAFSGGGDPGLASQVGSSDFAGLLGGGALEGIFKSVGETLANGIREITLEIRWTTGPDQVESVKFTQYVATDRPSLTPTAPVQLPQAIGAPGQRNPNTLAGTLGGQTVPELTPGAQGGNPAGAPGTASAGSPNPAAGPRLRRKTGEGGANFMNRLYDQARQPK